MQKKSSTDIFLLDTHVLINKSYPHRTSVWDVSGSWLCYGAETMEQRQKNIFWIPNVAYSLWQNEWHFRPNKLDKTQKFREIVLAITMGKCRGLH